MDQLALVLDSAVDADVDNLTGLQGWYALTLTYGSAHAGRRARRLHRRSGAARLEARTQEENDAGVRHRSHRAAE
jgi:hypothetical protein